jgi:transketolase
VSNQPQLDWTVTDERAVDLIRVLAMSAEAGITEPWRLFVGGAGGSIGVDHFGASAAYQKIYQEFGITAERVAAAARDSLARVRALGPARGTQGRESNGVS